MNALVLALNPSIDAEWRVERAQWEEKNTIQSERRWAGGKGVNVARWLRLMRGHPRLLLPLGGATGRELADYLHRERLPATTIALLQPTRVNVIVTTAAGGQLRFNPPGPKFTRTEWRAILRETKRVLKTARRDRGRGPGVARRLWRGDRGRERLILVLSGSLPRGLRAGAYAVLIRHARRAGVKTILDCDGQALAAAVPARPFLVKPNEHELAQWHGRPISSQAGLINSAFGLSARTKGWVLVSRGRRGALLVNHALKEKLSARPRNVKPVNTVGAGDAMVAAVARQLELGSAPEDWLRWGVAAGTAATQCAAGNLPSMTLIQGLFKQVKVG